MDFALARENMVKSQILPNRVTEPELLEVFFSAAREDFVDKKFKDIAYSDYPIAMGSRRSLTPLQIARLVQAMAVKPGKKILVVGAGTGYEALLLAKLGAEVYALESEEPLATKGKNLTTRSRIHWRVSPLNHGWPDAAPFDGILFCGAIPAIPEAFLEQLTEDGCLATILGNAGDVIMDMIRVDGPKSAGRPLTIFQTVADSLPGFPRSSRFEL
ncbi:MAG: protein-L-isoaspartate(D-aspartate) O-methyltransferase [Magnetococcales bacterium]|nr:protein-L-isoaspartate(D-aspartate) O-methyltransferase [Magnetococcales bacterium]HIJ83307.1 protein-L-isoaspartate O-methyltransferase [Magnetococcales bacterium]